MGLGHQNPRKVPAPPWPAAVAGWVSEHRQMVGQPALALLKAAAVAGWASEHRQVVVQLGPAPPKAAAYMVAVLAVMSDSPVEKQTENLARGLCSTDRET